MEDAVEIVDRKLGSDGTGDGTGGSTNQVVRLKSAIQVIKEEISTMNISIPLLAQSLMQCRVDQQRQHKAYVSQQQSKRHHRQSKSSNTVDDFSDDIYS